MLRGTGLRAEGLAAAVTRCSPANANNTVRLTLRAGTTGRLRLLLQLAHMQRRPALALFLGWTGAGQAAGEQPLALGGADT